MRVTTEREVAVQQQEKFEFYLLSLVFTLLALSVQTAKLGTLPVADYVEVTGWALLLISGVAGLSYVQMNPVVRTKMALKDEYSDELKGFRTEILQGRDTFIDVTTGRESPFAPLVENRDDAVRLLGIVIEKLERRQSAKYLLFTYCFVIGLIAVGVARAIPAFVQAGPSFPV